MVIAEQKLLSSRMITNIIMRKTTMDVIYDLQYDRICP